MFIWTCDDASGNSWSPKLLHKFNDVVWHVSWSITANILAVSGGDNKVSAAPVSAAHRAGSGQAAATVQTGPFLFAMWHVSFSPLRRGGSP